MNGCPWHSEKEYCSYSPNDPRSPVLSDQWCDEMLAEYGLDYRKDYSDQFRADWNKQK